MRAPSLTQHYGVLTPWERFALMVAADLRGDQLEFAQLSHFDPRPLGRRSECWPIAGGLDDLAASYIIGQLEIANDYWQIHSCLQADCRTASGKPSPRSVRRLQRVLRMFAYKAVLKADAWTRVCSELHIDGDALYAGAAGYQRVLEFLQTARSRAFAPDEAKRYVQQVNRKLQAAGEPTAPVEYIAPPVAAVAADMRRFLERAVASRGGPTPTPMASTDRAPPSTAGESIQSATDHEEHNNLVGIVSN